MRVLIIGLDGATFDLIRPWAAEGKLPNLARLLAEGSAGELKSTTPPMSPPAWSSFMTGKNPGKHGILDFTERKLGTYEIQFVSSRNRKAETVWKMLSRAGKRICVIGVPTTYPVEPVNGIMISGFDAPVLNGRAVHPPGLYAEVKEKLGEYMISPDIAKYVDMDQTDEAVDVLLESIARKAKVAQYLWRREAWDCFMVMFGETDKVVHHFWKHHDPLSPHHVPLRPGSRYADPIFAVYQRLDAIVGAFAEEASRDTTLMLVSDHGTGGSGDKIIYLNHWLEANGFLGFHRTGGLWIRVKHVVAAKVLGKAKMWVGRLLSAAVRKKLRDQKLGLAAKFESILRFSNIDWNVTRAYSEETSYYPNIWINLKGREPKGTVEPGADYEAVRDQLVAALKAWRDPETGAPVVERVWKREEIYHGHCTEKAPDLMISWALDRGYSYLSRPSYTSKSGLPISHMDKTESGISKFLMSRSGSHRDHGIVILKGSWVEPGAAIERPEIIDIAPTILSLLGLPVPADMDGHSLARDGAAIQSRGGGRAPRGA